MHHELISSPHSPGNSHSLDGIIDHTSISDSLSYIDAPLTSRPLPQSFGHIPEVHAIHHIRSFDPSVAGSSSLHYADYPLPNSIPSDISGPEDPLENIRALGRDGEVWDQRPTSEEERLWDTASEDSETQFVNFALLSHLAVRLRDTVPRGTHVKGSIPYPRAFTGKDIVSAIQSQIQRDLMENHSWPASDRRAALQVARSLQSQLFFYEVEWGSRMLQDGVEDVYMFLDDQDGSDAAPEREELPTGVTTILAKCYSPSCGEGPTCYVNTCPRKADAWPNTASPDLIKSLPASEVNRQIIIHKLISKEEQYVEDLDMVDSVFIKPLRMADPPVIQPYILEDFIDDVFGNILELRQCNKRLFEVMCVRQREQAPVIQRIGDIFLEAATIFRESYPVYVGHHPLAEKRMREEMERNPEFRLFIEHCSRQSTRPGDSIRLDLRHYLNRPSEHLQKYPVLLQAILNETAKGNPDAGYLAEAIKAIKNLQTVVQLKTFQTAMGKGLTSKWEWADLVPQNLREFTSDEKHRQAVIFELIKGEMTYVRDLENIEAIYIQPLRNAEPPIIPRDKLDNFIQDVFHNFAELHAHHRRLVDTFHEIQFEEHPTVRSITAAIFDAALNFREAYMEYIPNYPIAAYRLDHEMENNPAFRSFSENTMRHPDTHQLDMKSFINQPIPRLLRYEVLLKKMFDLTPHTHEDKEAIPHIVDVIKALGREVEPGVLSSKQKVNLWTYNANLVHKPGESIDMDLLNEMRSLIHTGKLLRKPDRGSERNGWNQLFVLLFDNYLVMTKVVAGGGIAKYHVDRRPIPLDLLTLVSFNEPAISRSNLGRSNNSSASSASGGHSDSNGDSRVLYPFRMHHNGRLGGPCVLYADSSKSRAEWKHKLEEALGLRKVVQESNKVFEGETLSIDTFSVPANPASPVIPWSEGGTITGPVTCSIPFNTPDGRGLVAIGCAEGVWIGFRHDSHSMRRVLHLKMVTQCTMLDDFGLFLVLADKNLFAYHIEALVPATPNQPSNASPTPQKLNGSREVSFFSVGIINNRTSVIYMRKRGNDSHFHVLEPVIDRINEKVKPSGSIFERLKPSRTEWFRHRKEFFLSGESYDLIFFKAKVAVLCSRGFEILDIETVKSVTLPQRQDSRFAPLLKRFDTCRPVGIVRSKEDEFLLCYDEFGIYVNKHGDPSRVSSTIEWEGTASSVAFHAPYVLLFDPRFIEIRHVETGRLAQIIPGNDVRCIWDGRGLSSNNVLTPGDVPEDQMVQEARVHAVLKLNDLSVQNVGRQTKPITLHVFELIPTIPIYLPGSLASPTTATFFPTFSPPRSPQLRPSYRA
ncbi:CNH domain-containing protein [Collybia nuda]|uniref:CNH domain-containing protein n=1 Tax=Collybia nuda TaxID=64659 RepID=A0A9P5YCJ3_9AGAR|nr:CNH domain-containing protein [Collybia nuda]